MSVHHNVHCRMRALKVRHQNFHFAAWNLLPDRLNREGKEFRAAISSVVPVHAGNHSVFESENSARFRHSPGLVIVNSERCSLRYGTKSAAPRADISQNHESCSAAIPALPYVRARSTFTNGVELKARDQVLELAIIFANRCRG